MRITNLPRISRYSTSDLWPHVAKSQLRSPGNRHTFRVPEISAGLPLNRSGSESTFVRVRVCAVSCERFRKSGRSGHLSKLVFIRGLLRGQSIRISFSTFIGGFCQNRGVPVHFGVVKRLQTDRQVMFSTFTEVLLVVVNVFATASIASLTIFECCSSRSLVPCRTSVGPLAMAVAVARSRLT